MATAPKSTPAKVDPKDPAVTETPSLSEEQAAELREQMGPQATASDPTTAGGEVKAPTKKKAADADPYVKGYSGGPVTPQNPPTKALFNAPDEG